MAEHLGPGAGEDELAIAEFELARLISSGVSKDNAENARRLDSVGSLFVG